MPSPEKCTSGGCESPATRTVQFPYKFASGVHMGHYCHSCADEILQNRSIFPGASEVERAP